ncbi:MAG: EamA family transporter [Firmicutes bacterium]|nr:EamA family transporter [Bacillota bacterium]
MERRALAAVAVTLLVWSSAFAGIRAGLRAYSPGHLLLARFLVASAAMGAYAWVARIPLPPRHLWGRLCLLGWLGITFYMSALTFGERTVPAAPAGFVVASSPVVSALLALAFLGERLGPRAVAGILLGLVGEGVIALGAGPVGRLGAGMALVAAAAVATAAFFVAEKPLLVRHPPAHVTAWVTWAGTLPFLVFLPGLVRQVEVAPAAATAAVVYLGAVPAALGYVTWGYALSRLPTHRAMSFLYLNPVLAAAIAWVWLGERPGWATWVGGAAVLAGVALVQGRQRAPRAEAVAPGGDLAPPAASGSRS